MWADRRFTKGAIAYRSNAYTEAVLPRVNDLNTEKRHVSGKSTQPVGENSIQIKRLVLAVLALTLRIEIWRRISNAPECSLSSLEIWLPLLWATYEACRSDRTQTCRDSGNSNGITDDSASSTYIWTLLRSRLRYAIPTSFICVGCHLISRLWRGLNSTFICPQVSGGQSLVPALQSVALLLDFLLLAVVLECRVSRRLEPHSKPPLKFCSFVLFYTAACWAVIGVVIYTYFHRHRYYVVLWDVPAAAMGLSILFQAVQFTVMCATCLYSVSESAQKCEPD